MGKSEAMLPIKNDTAVRSFVAACVLAAATVAPVPRGLAQNVEAAAASGLDPAKLGAIVDWLEADVEKGRVPGAVVLVALNYARAAL